MLSIICPIVHGMRRIEVRISMRSGCRTLTLIGTKCYNTSTFMVDFPPAH